MGACLSRGESRRPRRSRWGGSGTSASRGCVAPVDKARTAACSRCPRDPAAAPLRTNISPSSYVGGTCHATSSSPSALSRSRRPASGEGAQVLAVVPAGGRRRSGSPGSSPPAAAPGRRPGIIRSARAPKEGTPSPRATTSPSIRKSSPNAARASSPGKETVTSFSLRDQMPESALGAVHEDAHAVPLHLVGLARTAACGRPRWRASAAHRHPIRRSPASGAPQRLPGILITCVQSGRVPSPSAWSASR